MRTRKNLFLLVALLYILYTIFPLFGDMLDIPVWLPSLGAFVIMFLLIPNAFANKMFFWFGVYAVVLAIYLFAGRPLTIGIGTVVDSKKIFIEYAYILPTLSILSILLYLKDPNLTRKMVLWSIAILYVSFVVAVPLMFRYNSLRSALAVESQDIDIAGLPSYSLMHAYMLFLPSICYATKRFKGKQKLLSLVGLIALCFVIYDTFVTTSLLIMLAVVCFTIFYSDDSKSLFWVFFGSGVMLFLFLYVSGFFIRVIDWLLPFFTGTPVIGKLLDIQASMYLGEITGGNLVTRQELHAISWRSFFQNPLFGTSVVGNHSSLIDRLGGMGLLAFIPFVMIIITSFKRLKGLYRTKLTRVFFLLGLVSGVLLLYEKGLWGCESWLMYLVLMPFGIYVFENEGSRGEYVA